MAWNKKKTFIIFIGTIVLSLFFAIVTIVLVLVNLLGGETGQFSRSFLYLLATTFGNGLGCIWFRITQSKRSWPHGVIHTVVLILMLVGHREIFELLVDGEVAKCYNKYSVSILALIVYTIQFILAFHLVIFRYGRTPEQRAFKSGLHAFIGALTLFICVMDGLIVCNRMARDEDMKHNVTFHLASVCIICYGMCTWYILLNPYFDWRRLSALSQMQTSQTAGRSSSSRPMRSRNSVPRSSRNSVRKS